jgi:hypothetical protein
MLIVQVAGGVAVLALLALVVKLRWRKTHVDPEVFKLHWADDVQRLCGKSETWPEAVMNADRLLDEALKKCKCKGRTMGERLVAAQRRLTDNDGIWFAHKLSNKIISEEIPRLYKRDVQTALKSMRQALRDLGALEND